MKPRRMVMLDCLVLSLLLGLGRRQTVAANLLPGSVFSLHPFLDSTLPPPPAALSAQILGRAFLRPLELLADYDVLVSQCHVHPPPWETRGPPGLRRDRSSPLGLLAKRAAQSARECAHPLCRIPAESRLAAYKEGFATGFS